MKKLAIYDFDDTLMETPNPDPGKEIWSKAKGEPYPHKGWWGRKESLDTDVFEINPNPRILSSLNKDVINPNAYVVILTSRIEKLRPQVENILQQHNIVVDDVLLKRGNETKGDVILAYVNKMPELKKIEVYDDFAGGKENKIKEFTDIIGKLPEDIEYNIYRVVDGNFSLMESTNIFLMIILEEILKFK